MTEQTDKFEGWSELKLFTSEKKEICLKMRPEIEKKLQIHFKHYLPLVYREQIVAGTNYLFKVLVEVEGEGKCVHLQVFRALSTDREKLTVTDVDYPKTTHDPLIPLN